MGIIFSSLAPSGSKRELPSTTQPFSDSADKVTNQPLSETEITERLLGIPGWDEVDGKLVKNFIFDDLSQTIAFKKAIEDEVFNPHDNCVLAEMSNTNYLIKFITGNPIGDNYLKDYDFICAAKIDGICQRIRPESSQADASQTDVRSL